MKDEMARFTLRISPELLHQFAYVAEFEGRTKNKELQQMIRQRVREFEKEHGSIPGNHQTDEKI